MKCINTGHVVYLRMQPHLCMRSVLVVPTIANAARAARPGLQSPPLANGWSCPGAPCMRLRFERELCPREPTHARLAAVAVAGMSVCL